MTINLVRSAGFGAAFLAAASCFSLGASAQEWIVDDDTSANGKCIQRHSKHYSVWTYCPRHGGDHGRDAIRERYAD